mgnify:CR=1 FL=1
MEKNYDVLAADFCKAVFELAKNESALENLEFYHNNLHLVSPNLLRYHRTIGFQENQCLMGVTIKLKLYSWERVLGRATILLVSGFYFD